MTSEDFSAYGRAGVRAYTLVLWTRQSSQVAPNFQTSTPQSSFPNSNPRSDPWSPAEVVMLTELLVPPESVNE